MGLWDDERVLFFQKMKMFIEFSVEALEVDFEISGMIIRFIATFISRRRFFFFSSEFLNRIIIGFLMAIFSNMWCVSLIRFWCLLGKDK